jgi:hypothetical protein
MAEREYLASIEALKQELTNFQALELIDNYLQSKAKMNTLKRIWQALNTDITPSLLALKNQLAAIYDPHLVPIIAGGMIVDWVDARTGDSPWFS